MRPKIRRHICKEHAPKFSLFKPNGVPANQLIKRSIELDEFEAIRLVDLNELSQQDAAKLMQVSRQTFANILKKARKKVSSALINGEALILPTENSTPLRSEQEEIS